MEIHESGSREGEKNCLARVYRVVVDDDAYYYLGYHEYEVGLIRMVIMDWHPRINRWMDLKDKQTYPIELLTHLVEIGLVAQAKWKLPRKVYKIRGGPFGSKKTVKVPKGAPGPIERMADLAEAFTRFGTRLGG